MDYQPRTIAYLAELLHPPSDPNPRPLQKLHNELFVASSPPPYAGFQVTPGGAVLSNPAHRPQSVSQVTFLPDRIQFREELTALTPETFGERVLQVVEAAVPLRGIQVLSTSQVVLRSLVNPRHWRDSREFMQQAVLGVDEELETLGRVPGTYGLRLSFPPGDAENRPVDLRVESYNADPRSLFLEVRAAHGPIPVPQGLPTLREHVDATYRFLTDRALPFVGRFDARAAH